MTVHKVSQLVQEHKQLVILKQHNFLGFASEVSPRLHQKSLFSKAPL